jgi:O-antigen ligase
VAALILAPLLISTIFALFTDPSRITMRDMAAHTFTFFLACAFVVFSCGREVLLAKRFALTTCACLLIFAVLYFTPDSWGAAMRYQGDTKLQGLSNNPNQIAFLATISICLLCLVEQTTGGARLLLGVASGVAGVAGVLTESSAFKAALSGGVGVMFVTWLIAYFTKGRRPRIVAVLVPAAIVLSAAYAPAIGKLFPGFEGAIDGMSRLSAANGNNQEQKLDTYKEMAEADGGAVSVRLQFWRVALRLAAQKPIIGYGAGPHVPYVNSDTGEVTFNEVHNTPLDLLLSVGLLGISVLLLLSGSVFVRAISNGMGIVLVTSTAPIACFMLGHYIGRQPLFWFFVVVVAAVVHRGIQKQAAAI